MEKLIPLLNEKTGKEWVLETSAFGEDWLFLKGHPEVMIKEEKLISKKYGFIKWLVENDKIDIHKIPIIQGVLNTHSYEENLLMGLSISEQPIEFLISILK